MSEGWLSQLSLEEGEGALFAQIADGIVELIRAGKLSAGARLPGTRRLASALGVHRSTALAAYEELEAAGWISASASQGTFVAARLPGAVAPAAAPGAVGFSLRPARPMPSLLPAGVLDLGSGSPDVRLVPATEIARAWRAGLRRHAATLLDYGDPQGHPRLRAAIAQLLAEGRGVPARPETVLITRGSQMALYLAAHALLRRGDRVAVEALGYPPAWDALRGAGADLVPIPVDAEGLDVQALAAAHRQSPLRAVYLTPHHQFPTMVTLSASRRLALLAFAARERVAVIEDDYDHEFHFAGRPVLPLASDDPTGQVVYIGTLSKVLAPGLRLGFVVAPPPVVAALLPLRLAIDRQGDLAVELAVASIIEDGILRRHLRRSLRAYRKRRAALAARLAESLGGALSFSLPSGGLALWATASEGIDVGAWAEAALAAGVRVSTAQQYRYDGQPAPHLRLGFGRLDEAELATAVRRLATTIQFAPGGHDGS